MDLFENPHWNFMQVLTWVLTHDKNRVRTAGDPINNPVARTPLFLVDSDLVTTIGPDDDWPDPLPEEGTVVNAAPVTVALESVLTVLRSGRLVAEAIYVSNVPNDGKSQFIKKSDWAPKRGELQFDSDEQPVLVMGATNFWHGLQFERAVVMSIWPDAGSFGPFIEARPKSGKGRPPPGLGMDDTNALQENSSDSDGVQDHPTLRPRYSAARLKKAYLQRTEIWPNNSTPPSRLEDEKWAREEHGASRDAIRELRNEYAPEKWTQKGRRT